VLTSENLLGANNVSNFEDISLQLYKEFFDNVLCKRLFIYSLDDGRILKLKFEETNLLHILGAQHILGRNYKASKFNKEIIDKSMTFQILEKRNSIVFNDYTDRFLNFANIYHVITHCKMIYFSKEVYNKNRKSKEESLIDFSYILYEDLNNKKLHLGLDTYNNGYTYYGESLLVKSSRNDVLIKDQTPIRIKTIKVIDKKTKNVIEEIHYN
jgi:hypothetical protein